MESCGNVMMDRGSRHSDEFVSDGSGTGYSEHHFIAADILKRDDVAERQARLALIVSSEIVPRLMFLIGANGAAGVAHPDQSEIAELAHLVLSPDLHLAVAFVTRLRDRGLDMETLFLELLEPAARHLGNRWDNDEIDFIDVTLGVGRLQKLLAVFNGTHALPALDLKRRVILASAPAEQHSFGLSMIGKFMAAGGWRVQACPGMERQTLIGLVRDEWFAVAGITASADEHVDAVAAAIRDIRAHSQNPAIGVMVGGPMFMGHPDLVARVGADATALNAPAAVVLAQMLFDVGVKAGWRRPG